MSYRPRMKSEQKELEKWEEKASLKGKTLCGIKDMMRLMGKEKYMDAIYNRKLTPVVVIAYRSYYYWPLEEEET